MQSSAQKIVQGLPTVQGLPAIEETALFLDLDCTLVDLAAQPDAINVPGDLTDLLGHLAARLQGAVALVSGRSVNVLAAFVPGYSGVIVGGHGAEWRINGQITQHALTGQDVVADLIRRAEGFAARHPGVLVEPKPAGVVLHYRACPEYEPAARDAALTMVRDTVGFEMHPAKMAYELRPADVGKDKALRWLLQTPPFAGRLPVMSGDDATDEPAMQLARDRGGMAVKVGAGDSCADFTVDTPAEWHALLRKWSRG